MLFRSATVTVTDNGDGTLKAEVSYTSDGTIVNTYSVIPAKLDLEAVKYQEGKELVNGEFSFQLLKDGALVMTAKNDANGKVLFKDITFTKAGTYTFTIKEDTTGTEVGVTYDTTVYTVKVLVTDNGDGTLTAESQYSGTISFTNTYTVPPKPPVPDTSAR